MINLTFEAICKKRLSYKGILHTELAVNYDHSGLYFLGVYHAGNYYPHYKL